MLFTTGYLTKQGVTDDGRVRLSIQNREIKNLFIQKIREWFSDTTANDGKTLEQFCNAFVDKLKQDGMRNFIKYGIACFKKDCKVVVSE